MPEYVVSTNESNAAVIAIRSLKFTCATLGYDDYGVIDTSATFSETKRITRLMHMVQAGVFVTDYSTVAAEMLKDKASSKAGPLYGALDMPFAGLVGQLAGAFATR